MIKQTLLATASLLPISALLKTEEARSLRKKAEDLRQLKDAYEAALRQSKLFPHSKVLRQVAEARGKTLQNFMALF